MHTHGYAHLIIPSSFQRAEIFVIRALLFIEISKRLRARNTPILVPAADILECVSYHLQFCIHIIFTLI